ncbi:MAG TPA: MOSC domain-containing protein [Syntrophales bacterium]|nr:MOSC domain-containing protein [Syntrophales bacterium]
MAHKSISGSIVSINTGSKKGEKKETAERGLLVPGSGLKGDAHCGTERQVSLLAVESIDKIRRKGLEVGYGDFAENITTRGINLCDLPLGTTLQLGREAMVRITQIGKICHDRCWIFATVGDCVMPREGVFAEVLQGGEIAVGDEVTILGEL